MNQHRRRVRGSTEHGCFTVWRFDDTQVAEHASVLEGRCPRASGQGVDHAAVSWPVGAARPTTKHVHDDTRRGIGWGAFWGPLFGMLFAFPGRRCRSERGCRCLRQDAGRGRHHGRAAGTDPCGVTEGTSACPGHRAGGPRRLSWRAAAAERERGLRRHPERVRRAVYLLGIGGIDRDAEQAGRVAQDIPVNHFGFFAPVLQLTLDTGTKALVVAALAWLRGPRWR